MSEGNKHLELARYLKDIANNRIENLKRNGDYGDADRNSGIEDAKQSLLYLAQYEFAQSEGLLDSKWCKIGGNSDPEWLSLVPLCHKENSHTFNLIFRRKGETEYPDNLFCPECGKEWHIDKEFEIAYFD